ncbi:MAG: hypothetical protein MRJ96_03490 [Nitrospirales bacterium]|nr:hypothetical protein [Nitrospira sp.]MDR4500502.1 hypothetical protein [Nitrospirales bacterium]
MTRYFQPLIILVFVSSMLGCSSSPTYTTSEEVRLATTSTVDAFENVTWLEAPPVTSPQTLVTYQLRSASAKDLSFYQLYLHQTREKEQGWALFEHARGKDGEPLSFLKIDRQHLSDPPGGLKEVFAVQLTDQDVSRYAQTGLSLVLRGQHDLVAVEVPAFYFQGFLNRSHEPSTSSPKKP